MFVFNPRWDMHSLRAKEIKDSPNSQVVPKILVLLNNGTVWFHNCSGYSYFSNTHLHYYSFAQLASSDALRFPKIQDQGDLKDSLTLQAVLKSLVPAGFDITSCNMHGTYSERDRDATFCYLEVTLSFSPHRPSLHLEEYRGYFCL